ncbi:AzlC family ABC transporter permease [Nocardioides salsibiostraticola]
MTEDHRRRFRRGVGLGLSFSLVSFLLAMSFGVVAVDAGLSPLQAIVMSAVVHAGSAQFASVAILGAGGGLVPAVAAAGLMNSRFLAMGIALAPSLPGRAVRRGLQGQTVVDPSWVMANRGDGTFDRWVLFGATLPLYVGWVVGTMAGALGGQLLGDTDRWGFDAIYPTFFLALLIAELRDRRMRVIALGGSVIALALVPFTPPGIPVLAAAVTALLGLARGGPR